MDHQHFVQIIKAAGNYSAKYDQWDQVDDTYVDKNGQTRKTKKWKQVTKTAKTEEPFI